MKYKLYILIGLTIASFFTFEPTFGACSFGGDVKSSLQGCFGTAAKVVTAGNLTVETGVKIQVLKWVRIISGIIGLLAVGSIVYGGILFVISGGMDEKVTKGKNIIKWAIIGLIALIGANTLIALTVNIMFGIEG